MARGGERLFPVAPVRPLVREVEVVIEGERAEVAEVLGEVGAQELRSSRGRHREGGREGGGQEDAATEAPVTAARRDRSEEGEEGAEDAAARAERVEGRDGGDGQAQREKGGRSAPEAEGERAQVLGEAHGQAGILAYGAVTPHCK